MKIFTYIIGTVSAMLFVIGVLFKIQHWPGASVLLTLGLGVIGLVFIPLCAMRLYKKDKDKW